MDNFISYEVILTYATFVTIIFGVTQFLKDITILKKIPTKYLSFLIAVIILMLANIAVGSFLVKDVLLYILSSIFASMGANGIYDFDKKKEGE